MKANRKILKDAREKANVIKKVLLCFAHISSCRFSLSISMISCLLIGRGDKEKYEKPMMIVLSIIAASIIAFQYGWCHIICISIILFRVPASQPGIFINRHDNYAVLKWSASAWWRSMNIRRRFKHHTYQWLKYAYYFINASSVGQKLIISLQ